jgi:dimethylaniline monooxygenase (N-oxide forming)
VAVNSDFLPYVLFNKGCNIPNIPEEISPQVAKMAGFPGTIVHSSQFHLRRQAILDATKPISDPDPGHVVVVGCGRSAQELSSKFKFLLLIDLTVLLVVVLLLI